MSFVNEGSNRATNTSAGWRPSSRQIIGAVIGILALIFIAQNSKSGTIHFLLFEMIGAPIGIDDEVGANVGPRRLDEDVNAARCSGTAHRVADDPADRIARCDRPRSDEFLAFLQHDVGNLPRCGVNLEQGSIGIGILLDGIEIAGALRFHARCGVGPTNTGARVGPRGVPSRDGRCT